MKRHGFVLTSPSGKLIVETFATSKSSCWDSCFRFLYHKKWMQPFWKQWNKSIAEADKRGWKIVPVSLRVLPDK